MSKKDKQNMRHYLKELELIRATLGAVSNLCVTEALETINNLIIRMKNDLQ